MNMAWKEIKKNKVRFLILGSIVFLVSILTFIISGLANGLSQDNAALIKDLPDGQFYMTEDANQTINLSRIETRVINNILNKQKDAVAFSIQMGFLNVLDDKQQSVAFVASTDSKLFTKVNKGEIVLDSSMGDKGIKVGDTLTNNQFSGKFKVKDFVDQKKFSHAPVAYINRADFKEIYRVDSMQLVFISGEDSTKVIAGITILFEETVSKYYSEL
jgi:putative ABC transport system permease protein